MIWNSFGFTDCAKKLKDSLFLLGEVGGNDYNYAFMSMRPIEQTKLLVPDVVQAIVNAARVNKAI